MFLSYQTIISGFFYVLKNSNTVSLSEISKQDWFNWLYWIPVFIALITNTAPKIYSVFLVKNLKSENASRKFLVSLENAVAFSLVILLKILGPFLDRIFRLYFYYPMILMFCCDVFPFLIIMKHNKMKNDLKTFFSTAFDNLKVRQKTSNIVAPF